jgi:hypothetical protein
MKTRIVNFLIPMLGAGATSAFAADGALQDGGGPLVWFFIGFGVLVLMVQAVPALVMLYSMLRAVFTHAEDSKPAVVTDRR